MTKYVSEPVKITDITEHEDGSATLQVECDPETFAAIFNVGFIALVEAGLETESNKVKKKWQKCVSCGGPAQSDMCGFCLEEE